MFNQLSKHVITVAIVRLTELGAIITIVVTYLLSWLNIQATHPNS